MSDKENPPVRVSQEVYNELLKIQQKFREQHRGRISLSDIIAGLLADREAWQAMGEAALAAARKPVRS